MSLPTQIIIWIYGKDNMICLPLIDSGANTIYVEDGNGGWSKVGDLFETGEGTWTSEDGSMVLAGSTITLENGRTIALGNAGDFGINLLTPATNIIVSPNPLENIHGSEASDAMYLGGFGEMAAIIAAGEIAPASSGQDVAQGKGGDDFIYGSTAADLLLGGDGSDLLVGGGGNDVLLGDYDCNFDVTDWSIQLTETSATIYFSGDDPDGGGFLYSYMYWDGIGVSEVSGVSVEGTLEPTLLLGTGNNVIYGGAGDDFVFGGGGDDEIYGGIGIDTIVGGSGSDFIEGGIVIRLRETFKYRNTWRWFSQQENLRRAA
jgi:Ca2+-binding RTX toxin-like protein